MDTMKNKSQIQDEETKIIGKYKKPVLDILRQICENRQASTVCREKLGGMKSSRITELHTETRQLTSYYLGKLIQGEVVTIEQILQGKKISELPKDDQALFRKLSMDDQFVELYGRYQDKGKLDKLKKLMEISLED